MKDEANDVLVVFASLRARECKYGCGFDSG